MSLFVTKVKKYICLFGIVDHLFETTSALEIGVHYLKIETDFAKILFEIIDLYIFVGKIELSVVIVSGKIMIVLKLFLMFVMFL